MTINDLRPLGDVCSFHRGLTYNKRDEVGESSVVVLRANNIDVARGSLDVGELRFLRQGFPLPGDKTVRQDSILICTASGSRSHLGKAAYVDKDYGFAFGAFLGLLVPRPGIDGRFLHIILTTPQYRSFIDGLSDGVNINNLSFNKLSTFLVPVPPLREQRRIVAILNEAFAAITAATASTHAALQSASDLLQAAIDGTCTRPSSEANSVRLEDITTSITDGDHSPPPKAETGVPFITIGCIDKDSRTIDFAKAFSVPQTYYDSLKSNRKPQAEDILYTVTGSYGVPVLVDGSRRFCFQRHIGLIRPQREVQSKWLYYQLLTSHVAQQAELAATGTAQRTVGLRSLRSFQVPRHLVHEQEKIASTLDGVCRHVEGLRASYQSKLAALTELKQSILHKAFTGQLTSQTADDLAHL